MLLSVGVNSPSSAYILRCNLYSSSIWM